LLLLLSDCRVAGVVVACGHRAGGMQSGVAAVCEQKGRVCNTLDLSIESVYGR
jgi:hypothetical protein